MWYPALHVVCYRSLHLWNCYDETVSWIRQRRRVARYVACCITVARQRPSWGNKRLNRTSPTDHPTANLCWQNACRVLHCRCICMASGGPTNSRMGIINVSVSLIRTCQGRFKLTPPTRVFPWILFLPFWTPLFHDQVPRFLFLTEVKHMEKLED